jgi:tripartite-type tricarboxylate transporter receptor subunit TctC
MKRLPLVAFALAAVAALANAQSYPSKPILIIVPTTPSVPHDILARTAGKDMAERMGTTVVVENRPGASSTIGNAAVAKATPDGYTLLSTSTSFVINKALLPSTPYDPIRDFTPIALTLTGDMGLFVNSDVGVSTVADLVKLARSKPGTLTFGSPGNGTPQHMVMELFKLESGTALLHIPYKEYAVAVTDLITGRTNVMMTAISATGPLFAQLKTGKVKLLATMTDGRFKAMPTVPTFTEPGYHALDVHVWYGVLAPAGVPPAISSRLNAELNTSLKKSEILEVFAKGELKVVGGSQEYFADWLKAESDRWNRVVKEAALKPD